MTEPFGKLFESTYTGSMWGAGANVFAVWTYVIAHARWSTIELNPPRIAATLGMTTEEVTTAIEYLSSPDPKSRTKIEGGRRLVREGEFLYRVPTHEFYRATLDGETRRETWRKSKRKARILDVSTDGTVDNVDNDAMSTDVHSVHTDVHSVHTVPHQSTQAEAEAEAEAIKKAPVSRRGRIPPVEIPEWVPHEQWEAFIEMRKAIKKPLTSYAIKRALNVLKDLRTAGHDLVAVLNNSIFHNWSGLFPPKGESDRWGSPPRSSGGRVAPTSEKLRFYEKAGKPPEGEE